jgi:hypothetical protein
LNSLKGNEEAKATPWPNEKHEDILEKELIKMNIKKGIFLDLDKDWNTSNSTF